MARELWAKAYVEMKDDPKLCGRPEADRWLWLGLILLAKEKTEDGILHGYTPALLKNLLVLTPPVRKVKDALDYFATVDPPMVRLHADGAIELINFKKRQAVSKDSPEAVRERQQRRRDKLKQARDDEQVTGPVTGSGTRDASDTRHAEEEEEEDREEEKQEEPRAASAAALPSLVELESDWPQELLARVKLAVTSTRKSGEMAEGPWRAFLMRARNFAVPIRVRAAETYLERAMAADRKDEAYLLGIMRNDEPQGALVMRSPRTGAAQSAISPEVRREHEIPGKKWATRGP